MNLVYRTSDGTPVSYGTQVAHPLADGLTALPISDETWTQVRRGLLFWDPATLTFTDVAPPEPDVADDGQV